MPNERFEVSRTVPRDQGGHVYGYRLEPVQTDDGGILERTLRARGETVS